MRAAVLALVMLAGCSAPAATPATLVLHSGDPGRLTLHGRYAVNIDAPGCTYSTVDWTTDAGRTVIAAGSTVELEGTGYLNRTADCELTVTLRPA